MKHIISGLIAALLGIWGIIVWWYEFGAVMRGLLPFALLAFGIIAIIAGLQAQQQEAQTEAATEGEKAEELTEEAPEGE